MNLKRLKNYLVITLLALVSVSASAQTSASAIEAKKQTLFSSANHSSTPYRIPAIATLINGDILALADQRPCGADVGNGEVDIYAKVSKDNGATWTPSSNDPSENGGLMIADGSGKTSEWNTGFGDAAVVVDRESGDVLVICVAGKQVFSKGTSSDHNKMARIKATYDEKTGELDWQAPEDVTTAFFDNLLPKAYTMFMASGRMIQSTMTKVGSHYRVYGALLVKDSSSNYKNYVVYSDDFGVNWSILGNTDCITSADEAKVEELPNGDIVVSSRTAGGRIFNLFNFSDKEVATGEWKNQTSYTFAGSNTCNGELLFYEGLVDANGTKYNVMLQSLPTGEKSDGFLGFGAKSGREKVSVYYKAFATNKASWSVSDFTSGWTKGIEVDNGASAYSTMTILENGEIGFLYEDNYDTSKADGDYSDIVFVPLTVSEITGGAYTYVAENDEPVLPTVATPVIAPNGGTIFKEQAITLSCNTEGATIYYTIDGTEPTVSSTKYEGEFTLSASATVKAIAVKEGCNDSQVVSATYTVVDNDKTKVRFKNVQNDGTVYYFTYDATNGIGLSTDVNAAALYTRGNGQTSGTYTFQTADGNYLIFSGRDLSDSNNRGYNSGKGFLTSYESAKCDLTVATMVAGGNVESFTGSYVTITGLRDFTKKVLFTSTTTQKQAYFVITPDGKFNGADDPYFNDSYSSAFLIEEVVVEPEVKKVAAPVFSLPSGTYEEGTELTISCPTEGARIFLTIDGTTPTIESIEVPNGFSFELGGSMTINAIAVVGENYSEVVTVEYFAKLQAVNTPIINPNGGAITSDDKISITCSDINAIIYYTIDGTEPTEASILYLGRFTLEKDATVKAIAVRRGWANSEVATAEFTVNENETKELTVNFEKGYMNGFTRYMTTFSAPFATTIPSSVKVYIVKKITSSYTYFTRLYNNNIPAYTGVLLQASKAGEIVISEAEEGANMANVSGNILINTADAEVVLDTDAYVFSKNSSNKYAFYLTEAGEVVPQYSAYYVLGNSYAKVHAIGLSFDDETGESSGIEDVNAEDAEVEYYNLQGVKVENPEKGIYIMKQGGKTSKVVL